MKIIVRQSRCPQNHKCPALKVCPVSAISQNGYSAPFIDEKACIKCKKCVKICPMGALTAEAV